MKGKKPMTATERNRAMTKAREKAGWKKISLWLTPEAKNCLNAILERSEEIGKPQTQNDIINEALTFHYKR